MVRAPIARVPTQEEAHQADHGRGRVHNVNQGGNRRERPRDLPFNVRPGRRQPVDPLQNGNQPQGEGAPGNENNPQHQSEVNLNNLLQQFANIASEEGKPRNQVLETMCQCVICGELEDVRAHVYTCMNGHVTCQECRKNPANPLEDCPTCRSGSLNHRSRLIENYIETELATIVSKCPNPGCEITYQHQFRREHKALCPQREIKCITCREYGQVEWIGPASQYYGHLANSKCSVVLFEVNYSENKVAKNPKFRHAIYDTNQTGASRYTGMNTTVHKPIYLVSKTGANLLIFLEIIRMHDGGLMIAPFAHVPQLVLDMMEIELRFELNQGITYNGPISTAAFDRRTFAQTCRWLNVPAGHLKAMREAAKIPRDSNLLGQVSVSLRFTDQFFSAMDKMVVNPLMKHIARARGNQ